MFNGGLNLRMAPHLVPPEQGVQYNNIDNSKGHFAPMKHKRDVSEDYPALEGLIEDYGFFFDIAGEAYFTETVNDWVVYKEELYWGDRVGRPQRRIANHSFVQLGISAPNASGVTLVGYGAEDTDTPISYYITYYNNTTGAESAPSFVGTLNRHATSTTLGSLPASADAQVTHIRIYRVGGDITTQSMVAAVLDTAGSYVDTLADDAIDGRLLTTSGYQPAPVGAKYLTEFNAMLFAADGDQLRFTPIGVPYAWPLEYFLDMPGTITGIGKTPVGLLVFTRYKTVLVTGTGPATLTQQLLTDDQGCISHDSIVNIRGQAVWLSLQGLCASTGDIPVVLTKEEIGAVTVSVVNAIEYNEAYYVHNETTGSLAVFDFAFGELYKTVGMGNTKSLVKVNEKLFALGEGKIWDMFSADYTISAKYKSGWLHEGNLMQLKTHDRFRMAFTGTITLTISTNGAVAFTKTYTTTKSLEVVEGKLPHDKCDNYYIEVELEGEGEVFELEIPQSSANG
jgi:hypothetical protein